MDKRKKVIIGFVLFILVLIGITVIYNYFINRDTKQLAQENALENGNQEEKMKVIEIQNVEQFEQEVMKESGVVFVDFYATWCTSCKEMDSIIDDVAKEHKEVKFVKVDIDKNEELAEKYNIKRIPTMFIVKNGEITKKFVDVVDKESIVKEF